MFNEITFCEIHQIIHLIHSHLIVGTSWCELNTFEAISDRALLRCVWCKGKTILTDPTWTTYLYSIVIIPTPGCCPSSPPLTLLLRIGLSDKPTDLSWIIGLFHEHFQWAQRPSYERVLIMWVTCQLWACIFLQ